MRFDKMGLACFIHLYLVKKAPRHYFSSDRRTRFSIGYFASSEPRCSIADREFSTQSHEGHNGNERGANCTYGHLLRFADHFANCLPRFRATRTSRPSEAHGRDASCRFPVESDFSRQNGMHIANMASPHSPYREGV